MTKAVAPCKIILFGEHSVVYGKLGIAGAISKYVSVSIKQSKKDIRIIQPKPYPSFSRSKDEIFSLLKRFRKLYKDESFDEIKKLSFTDALAIVTGEIMDRHGWKPVQIKIEFDKSLKGIGRSSAVFSALATALLSISHKNPDMKEVSEIAYLGDVVAHAGMPSGIDSAAVTYGNFVKFTKEQGPKQFGAGFKFPILLVDSGESPSTREMVYRVRRQFERRPHFVSKVLDQLNEIALSGLDAIQKQDFAKIGSAMTEYYRQLRQLGISTENLDHIIKIALENGALGAKPTGAWGGGACVVLAENKKIKGLLSAFKKAGYPAFKTEIGIPGVHLI